MQFSWLRRTVAWWVFFTICTIITIAMMFIPVSWLSLLAVYPAYLVSIKFVLLPAKLRKTPHAFWMPATLNMITVWLFANIFGPALFRLFAPAFIALPEELQEFAYYVWPMMIAVPASYICYLVTIPDVSAWTDHGADGQAQESNAGSDESQAPAGKSFLNKYTANDENAG
jgi:hypothetical protein